MSGLLALLDDVAAIAKVAAASVDDIAAAAGKAGAKAAGVVIDDAAVTPKYVTGFSADRELPIVWKIAKGSLRSKILILLPALLLLATFLPQALTPLLMLGGAYLCFEGAEKVWHAIFPHAEAHAESEPEAGDPAHLEEQRVAGAIKTDFILSAEIMTIALSEIEASTIWMQAITLGVVGVAITALVYGAVALIVKMDDIGLHMAAEGRTAAVRGVGRGLVAGMPAVLSFLSTVGTVAMLWVGGHILSLGLKDLGWPVLYDQIHYVAEAARAMAGGFAAWLATASLDAVVGFIAGSALIPLVTRVIVPAWGALAVRRSAP